jgi:hypothetical protein
MGLVTASIISKRGRVSIFETVLLSLLATPIFALPAGIWDCHATFWSASCIANKVSSYWLVSAALTLVTALILRWLLVRWKVMRAGG